MSRVSFKIILHYHFLNLFYFFIPKKKAMETHLIKKVHVITQNFMEYKNPHFNEFWPS